MLLAAGPPMMSRDSPRPCWERDGGPSAAFGKRSQTWVCEAARWGCVGRYGVRLIVFRKDVTKAGVSTRLIDIVCILGVSCRCCVNLATGVWVAFVFGGRCDCRSGWAPLVDIRGVHCLWLCLLGLTVVGSGGWWEVVVPPHGHFHRFSSRGLVPFKPPS